MNAVDAMSSITGHKRVLAIKTGVCEFNEILLTVEDAGTGIDPAHINNIASSRSRVGDFSLINFD
jgi:C4-dicarboxylate-specific signal transduction histidine kinase